MLAGCAGVDLREGLEQGRHGVGRDPRAGVAHGEAHDRLRCSGWLAFGTDDHLALLRELDRVADEVDEHLAQQARVAANVRRQLGIDVCRERNALLARGHSDDVGDALDDFDEVEVGQPALDLVGLDLGQIEDVVDDPEQVCSRSSRNLGKLGELRCQLGVKHQVETADYSVHRRTNLMTHRGKKLGLDHRGPQRSVAGLGKATFGGPAFGDVVNEGDKELLLTSLKRRDRSLERELRSVAASRRALDPGADEVQRVRSQPLQQLVPHLTVAAGDEARDRIADRRLALHAVQPLGGAVEVDDLAVGRERQDRIQTRGHDRALQFLAAAELQLGELVLGDVGVDRDHPVGLSLAFAEQRFGVDGDPDRGAVRLGDREGTPLALAARERKPGGTLVPRQDAAVLADGLEARIRRAPVDDVLEGHPDDLDRPRVGEDHTALAVVDEDAFAHRPDQAARNFVVELETRHRLDGGGSRELFVPGGHGIEDKAAASQNRGDWPDVGVILEARQ